MLKSYQTCYCDKNQTENQPFKDYVNPHVTEVDLRKGARLEAGGGTLQWHKIVHFGRPKTNFSGFKN